MVGLHALEPLVDQRRLAGAALGDEREDVDVAIGPGLIEALQLGVAADEALVAGLGQAGDVDDAWRARQLGRFCAFRRCGRGVAAGCLFLIEHGRRLQARRLCFFLKRRAYGGFMRNTLSGAVFFPLMRTGVFPSRLPSRSSAAIP